MTFVKIRFLDYCFEKTGDGGGLTNEGLTGLIKDTLCYIIDIIIIIYNNYLSL